MNIKLYTEPIHFIYVEDVYDNDELQSIWQELDHLNCDNKLLHPNSVNSTVENNTPIKNNKSVFLEDHYKDPNLSNILSVNIKIIKSNVINQKDSWFFKDLRFNRDSTLVSYYEGGDDYQPHKDNALVTACSWFFKEPKRFSGGDFYFVDYNTKIKVVNNTAVIFPSHIRHAVDSVNMNMNDQGKGLGRYCISQFLEITNGHT